MTHEEFYKQVESVVRTHYSEVGIANGVIAVLEKFRLDEEAAQQGVEPTCPNCGAVGGHYLSCITYRSMHNTSGSR